MVYAITSSKPRTGFPVRLGEKTPTSLLGTPRKYSFLIPPMLASRLKHNRPDSLPQSHPDAQFIHARKKPARQTVFFSIRDFRGLRSLTGCSFVPRQMYSLFWLLSFPILMRTDMPSMGRHVDRRGKAMSSAKRNADALKCYLRGCGYPIRSQTKATTPEPWPAWGRCRLLAQELA